MSILAGLCVLDAAAGPQLALRERLNSALTRRAGIEPIRHDGESIFITKIDLGICRGGAIHSDSLGNVTAVVGEPLLPDPESPVASDRTRQTAELHDRLTRGDMGGLRDCRGTYCGVHFHGSRGQLRIFVDRVGVRPLYFTCERGLVTFASSLRILQEAAEPALTIDARGLIEQVCLGYPLARRTIFNEIRVLRGGESVRFLRGEPTIERYWRWDDLEISTDDRDAHAAKLHRVFEDAVNLRLDRRSGAVAFLSGGLDSRSVVALVHAEASELSTYNFGFAGSQDLRFGDEFARRLGTKHSSIPTISAPPEGPEWSRMMRDALDDTGPRRAWSGDGGSVCLGHVYMTKRIVEQMRAGRIQEAVESYYPATKTRFLRRLMSRKYAEWASRIIQKGIEEELLDIRASDPGRAFHVFLVDNDQRRHLFRHFEDIDEHQIELILPFFDAEFVSAVMQAPVDHCLEHRLYMIWMRHLPPLTREVPWQSYPGHVPCRLPIEDNLTHQWDPVARKNRRKGILKQRIRDASDLLRDPGFPKDLLSRSAVRMAKWGTMTGFRDYGYVLAAAVTLAKYWRASGKRPLGTNS